VKRLSDCKRLRLGRQNESLDCPLAPYVAPSDGWRSIKNLPQATPEEKIVRQTVDSYLHGLKFNEIESFKRAFHPEAKLFFVPKNDELGQLTLEQWYKQFRKKRGKRRARRSADCIGGRYGKGRLSEGRLDLRRLHAHRLHFSSEARRWMENREQDFRGGETCCVMCH
jgi:hypothetical protein